MSRSRFALLAIAIWLAPAFVAGALDWPGIWGGGSAFSDLLLPAPITGGIIHVPTFVVALLLIRASPQLSDRANSVMRALCLVGAIVGLLLLIDFERLQRALTTDYAGDAWRLDESYLGLVLLTDAAWCVALIQGRSALARLALLAGALFVLAPAIAVVTTLLVADVGRGDSEVFRLGRDHDIQSPGEYGRYVISRLRPNDPSYRERALEFAAAEAPEYNVNAEAVALFFTDAAESASEIGREAIYFTLCLYEDGRPHRWEDREADCFADYETRYERRALLEEAAADLPPDVQRYLVARAMCEDVSLPERYDDRLAAVAGCWHVDLDALREAAEAHMEGAELDVRYQSLPR